MFVNIILTLKAFEYIIVVTNRIVLIVLGAVIQ